MTSSSSSPHQAAVPHSTTGKETEPQYDFAVKVILLGDVGVGKTTFFHNFLHGHPHPSSTQEAQSGVRQIRGHRIVDFDGKKVRVTLWDTGGQERYRSMTQSYYRGAHACIIIYDTNNRESFDNVTYWLESLEDYDMWSGGTVTLLVGMGRADRNKYPAHHTTTPVDCQQVSNLACHYHLPNFEQVDCHKNPWVLDLVMNIVVTLVMSKALGKRHMLHSLRPHTTLLHRLHSTRERCCACPGHCDI